MLIRVRHSVRPIWFATLLLFSMVSPVRAQNYSFDARRIALGGTGGTPNIASALVEDQRRYTSIVIPVGLIRVLTNLRVFYPNRDDFDFVRAVEFATRPLHFTFGRRRGRARDESGSAFANDLARGEVNRDINAYRGFAVADSIFAEGLAAPNWGKTFMLRQNERGFHGIYAGAGPYFAARAEARFDASLVNLLGGSSDVYLPFASFGVAGGEVDQLAAAFTGGYRARFPLPGRTTVGTGRDGVYVAANYHYLHGIRLDNFNAGLRLETDLEGLINGQPTTPPLAIAWETSRSGRGFALDFGAAFVVNRWEFGVGVSGVANRLVWRNIKRHDVTLPSLVGGHDFVHLESRLNVTRRFDLPVTYTGDVAYHREKWSVLTEYARGFQGHNFLTGFEYRLGTTDLRAGTRLSQGRWYPSGGIGFHVTRRLAVDVAAFGTKSFLEQQRRLVLAVSLRLETSRREAAVKPLP